ncbi:nucleoporin subcomplex protein binding to Pom34-domain-containing protein [Syncephalastrum racemosum]|uniref:Nucleoporin NUP188 n=1 Tax=Syncephalastrum racemosum TaxID=13706 RepID=A0A1X2H5E7_SYNRA|nr:nucleoporin subcomplex protein binding to Pom34-domain-containing protein [Syncephalastrum racemosum]
MAPHSDQLDERYAGTYRKLFDTIERGADQCSLDRLQTALEERARDLKLGLDCFGRPNASARSKIQSGSVAHQGRSFKLDTNEKDLVLLFADTFNINELMCACLWDTFRREHTTTTTPLDDALKVEFMTFYHEERLSVLQCIASLLRVSYDGSHPFHAVAAQALDKVLDEGDEFIERLLTQLKVLVRATTTQAQQLFATIPAYVWAKQRLSEQKALLEIVAVYYFSSPCHPKHALAFLEEFEETNFGLQQTSCHMLDREGELWRDEVSYLCVLLSIQVLNLPLLRRTALSPRPSGDVLLQAPEVLVKIGQIVPFLGDHPSHAPFLLAWSYLLSIVDELLQTTSPTAYANVRKLIDGELDMPTTRAGLRGTVRSAVLDVQHHAQIYRLFAGRALKLDVFDTLSVVLGSALCDTDAPNDLCYRSTIKHLLSGFFSKTHPSLIPQGSFDDLIDCVSKLFDKQTALCEQFWQEDIQHEDLAVLLRITRLRFPVAFKPFIQLLSSLTGSRAPDSFAAKRVFSYLQEIGTITVFLKDNVDVRMDTLNEATVVEANQAIQVMPSIAGRAALTIPAGARGSLYSPEQRIVQFDVHYSGWKLVTGILTAFVTQQNQGSPDMDDPNHDLDGANVDTVTTILVLIRNLLSADPALATILAAQMQAGRTSQTPVLVDLLCSIVSLGCSVNPHPISAITASLDCLSLLLPYFRDSIWQYLHTSPFLPRPSVANAVVSMRSNKTAAQVHQLVSKEERKRGRYPLMMAFLDLVKALVGDVQKSWWLNSAATQQQQVETLYACLHYLMLDVFPAYATWPYKFLTDRFTLGAKVLGIFIEVVDYFQDPVGDCNTGMTLGQLRSGLIRNFLNDGGSYLIAPLLDLVSEGAQTANTLFHQSRPQEARRAERLTELMFIFIKLLLQQQLEASRQGAKESTLERLMLERVTGTGSPDFLLQLTKHIYYQHNISLQILSTHIVTLLCRNLIAWSAKPDFVRHLGDKQQAQSIIKTYLGVAQDKNQDERLLAAIWQMITLLLETQPSLSILFLECNDRVLPSPKSAVKLLEEQKKKRQTAAAAPPPAESDSAVRAAVDLLGQWEELMYEKPTVLSNVLRFLATFWETAYQHYALVQYTRSDSALWDCLGRILLSQHSMTVAHQDLTLSAPDTAEDTSALPCVSVSNENANVRRVCCLHISKAMVMRIMALEVHLTSGANKQVNAGTSALAEKLPAGLRNQLQRISETQKMDYLQSICVRNDYNAASRAKIRDGAEKLLGMVGSSNAARLIYTTGHVGFGDDGASGEPRQYGDFFLYDLRQAEARAQSLLAEIEAKYHVVDHEDTIVTPQVHALREIKKTAHQVLNDLCLANHNASLVDAQNVLQQAYILFNETCAGHDTELLWPSKNADLRANGLYDLLLKLLAYLEQDLRDDGVTLIVYSRIVMLLRALTENWVGANQSVLLGNNANHRRAYADKAFALLMRYSALMRHEPFTLLESISEHIAVPFHRPLLEAVLLPLRTLRRVHGTLPNKDQTERVLGDLLDSVCESFQMMVYKAAAFRAKADEISPDANEACVKDLTVTVALLVELIRPTYQPDNQRWMTHLSKYDTIGALLRLTQEGIAIMVKEVAEQSNAASIHITPYAENAFFLLLDLAAYPVVASALVAGGLLELLCNNALTPHLQRGALDMFLRFHQNGAEQVERNPLHVVWCNMLSVIGTLLRTLANQPLLLDKILRCASGFMQIYGPQIDKAFATANGLNASLLGIAPSESLSSCLLEEVDRITQVVFGLAQHAQDVLPYAQNILVVFKDCGLALMQRYLYFFTHPAHMQAQLYPVTEHEKRLAHDSLPSVSSSSFSSQPQDDLKQSKLMQTITHKAIRIYRTTLLILILLTNVDKTLHHPPTAWEFGNTILEPSPRVVVGERTSFGTLVECTHTVLGWVKDSQEVKDRAQLRAIRNQLLMVEGCLTLLVTQVALWIHKPGLDEEIRHEIAEDNLMEIMQLLGKVYDWAGKVALPMTCEEQKTKLRSQVVTYQKFLAARFFDV